MFATMKEQIFPYMLILLFLSSTISLMDIPYEENCFVKPNSKVAWVVNFHNLSVNNADDINMQTQSITPFKGVWKNLTGCAKLLYSKKFSVLCEIDEAWFRLTYNIRVVYFRPNDANEVLFRKDDQYQHGLLCFKDHGILNLTYSHLTSTSADILWNFYVWDIEEELIKETNIILHSNKNDILRKSEIQKNKKLNRVFQMRWLDPCTKYKVVVENVYYSLESNEIRRASLNITTPCGQKSSVDMFSATEVIIINISVIVFVLIFVAGCKMYRRGLWAKGRREDCIDTIVLIEEEGYYSLSHQTEICDDGID